MIVRLSPDLTSLEVKKKLSFQEDNKFISLLRAIAIIAFPDSRGVPTYLAKTSEGV
jgi:hypothetical protein